MELMQHLPVRGGCPIMETHAIPAVVSFDLDSSETWELDPVSVFIRPLLDRRHTQLDIVEKLRSYACGLK